MVIFFMGRAKPFLFYILLSYLFQAHKAAQNRVHRHPSQPENKAAASAAVHRLLCHRGREIAIGILPESQEAAVCGIIH